MSAPIGDDVLSVIPTDPQWQPARAAAERAAGVAADLAETHCADGFASLAVTVPCCGAATSLDVLDYHWPCGFVRFEIAIWNPERTWFDGDDLT